MRINLISDIILSGPNFNEFNDNTDQCKTTQRNKKKWQILKKASFQL